MEAATKEFKRIKMERGEDEDEKGDDDEELLQTALAVARAAEGLIALTELQFEGKKRMATREFLAGHPLRPGAMLGQWEAP